MLELAGVSRHFGDVTAVGDVTLTVPSGVTLGLLGPNGAGKTTTMRMILGILVPDAGTIRFNGAAIDEAQRRRFGYLPEERGLYGKMSVIDQLVYFGRLHGLTARDALARADVWIERLAVGEYANRRCAELSKGNQQKIQVACAALHEPDLLILDEPFSGLDPVNAQILVDVLADERKRGATLILSSHQMWQIETLCDRFCIIARGAVRAAGTLAELRHDWLTRVIEVEPASAASAAVLAAVPGAQRLSRDDDATLAYTVPAQTELPALARRLVDAGDVTRFERIEPSLNDIYLRAIGGERA